MNIDDRGGRRFIFLFLIETLRDSPFFIPYQREQKNLAIHSLSLSLSFSRSEDEAYRLGAQYTALATRRLFKRLALSLTIRRIRLSAANNRQPYTRDPPLLPLLSPLPPTPCLL